MCRYLFFGLLVFLGTTAFFAHIFQGAVFIERLDEIIFTRNDTISDSGFRTVMLPMNNLSVSEEYPKLITCIRKPENWACDFDYVDPEYYMHEYEMVCAYNTDPLRVTNLFAYKIPKFHSHIVVNECQFQYSLRRVYTEEWNNLFSPETASTAKAFPELKDDFFDQVL